MNNISSNQLFQKVQEDDMIAFEMLFKRLSPRLTDFARKVVADKQLADDMVQEVFIKVWEKRQKIENANIEAFIFRVLRNHCISHLKHLKVIENVKTKVLLKSEEEELYRIDFIRDEPYLVIEKELQLEIEKVINELPEKCREVFLLSRIEGLKNREIAEKLNINIKNVERHITRALKTFKSHFGDAIPITIIIFIIKALNS